MGLGTFFRNLFGSGKPAEPENTADHKIATTPIVEKTQFADTEPIVEQVIENKDEMPRTQDSVFAHDGDAEATAPKNDYPEQGRIEESAD